MLLKNVYAENQSSAIYAVFLAVCEVFLISLSKYQKTSMWVKCYQLLNLRY